MKAYEEIVQFIAETAGLEKLARFRPSAATVRRVATLTERHKQGVLRPAEREELEQFLKLEHVMRLAKARARRLAAHA